MSSDWRSAELPDGVTHRIFMVRHGETEHSARGLCYGKLDVALSADGEWQASAAAKLLKPLNPCALYSSPRIRAMDTATAIGIACELEINTEESLAELDFGDFEGLTYEEAEHQYPELYKQWMTHPTSIRFPNGESYSQMSERVRAVLASLKTKHEGQSIVTVAHGGVNRIALSSALNLSPDFIFRLDQSYGAINCIDYYEDTPLLRIMNWLS